MGKIRFHMTTGGKFGGALALVFAVTSFGPHAYAQTVSDKAAAEGLFDQGRAAMREGDFAKACGLLERSQHIDPGVGTLLYLAECYEKSGRTASAWATFREAADAAEAAHESARARTGRDRAQRLESQLSRLTIEVAPENQQLRGLSIDRRDRSVQQATWNVPVPTDPGEYAITASAPGYETWTGTVTVPERAGRASIAIPPLKKSADADKAGTAALPSPPADVKPANAEPSSAPLKSAEYEAPGRSQRTTAYFVGAVGLVGIGVGSFFGIRAISKNSEVEDLCPPGRCSNTQASGLFDEAKTSASISNVAIGLGAAALLGGVVLYLTAPSTASTESGPRASARLGPGSIMLEGTFQ